MALTREQLRSEIISQDDMIRNSWFVWNRMTQTQKNLVIAGRQTISRDVPNTNNYLDDYNANLSTLQSPLGLKGTGALPPSLNDVIEAFKIAFQALVAWLLGLKGT